MIRFELNDTSYAVTNDAMATMVRIMAEDWSRDYDIVEHNESGKRTDAWLWVHPVEDADAPDENPIRHWITEDGEVVLSEEVTWDWKGIQHDN
jgi:hypothetical protein